MAFSLKAGKDRQNEATLQGLVSTKYALLTELLLQNNAKRCFEASLKTTSLIKFYKSNTEIIKPSLLQICAIFSSVKVKASDTITSWWRCGNFSGICKSKRNFFIKKYTQDKIVLVESLLLHSAQLNSWDAKSQCGEEVSWSHSAFPGHSYGAFIEMLAENVYR